MYHEDANSYGEARNSNRIFNITQSYISSLENFKVLLAGHDARNSAVMT